MTALFSPTAAGTVAVVINEVFTNGTAGASFVELKNAGASSANLTGYYLCQYPSYWPFPSGVTIPSGGFLVIHWNATGTNTATNLYTGTGTLADLSPSSGEVGFYSSNGFGSSSDDVDYVEWGNGGHTREAPAVGAGIWSTGDFAVAMTGGLSLNLVSGSPGNKGCNYALCPPSPGS